MSFNDFAHVLHRYGVLSSDARHVGELEDGPTATRRVFEGANRGTWPGDGKVTHLRRIGFIHAVYEHRLTKKHIAVFLSRLRLLSRN